MGSRELGGKHFRRGRAEPGANTGGKPSLSLLPTFLLPAAQFLSVGTNWSTTAIPPPTLGDHTTGSGRWHNPVFERSALQWQPGTSATSAAPRLPGFGQWGDKKVKRFSEKENVPHIISLPAMVIFCWVFRRHQYSVVLNILGTPLRQHFRWRR